jgi:hypothetical protein
VFLLYINKFNTSLERIYFYFSRVLGRIIIVLEESSIYVSCLYKQIPFITLITIIVTLVSVVVTLNPVDIGLY